MFLHPYFLLDSLLCPAALAAAQLEVLEAVEVLAEGDLALAVRLALTVGVSLEA